MQLREDLIQFDIADQNWCKKRIQNCNKLMLVTTDA